MEVRFTQSARKHRIGKAHAIFVMSTCDPSATVTLRGEEAHEWIGLDQTGRELHIIGVEKADAYLLIIHVFPTALKEKQ